MGKNDTAVPGSSMKFSLFSFFQKLEQQVKEKAYREQKGKLTGRANLTSLRPCENLVLRMQMRQIQMRLEAAVQKICSN